MSESTLAPTLTPEPIMQMLQGYQVTAILRTGVELGVFEELARGRDDPASIAEAIGADRRGTRILLDGLAALGLVVPVDGLYRLTPLAETFLVREGPTYIGDMTRILADDWEWDAYKRLPEAVRRGGTVQEEHAETPAHPWWVNFATSIGGMAAPAAAGLARILEPWAAERRPLEILDVACGNGLYSLTLVQQHEHARATLLDWPNVLAVTRGVASEMGLADRVRFVEGDVFEVDLGGPYDLVIASHVFHHFNEQRCLDLLRRLASALKEDGRIAIQEFAAAEAPPAEDPWPRLFSVLMLVWTREGEAHPVSLYEHLLVETGFAPPEVHQLPGLPSRFIVAGRA